MVYNYSSSLVEKIPLILPQYEEKVTVENKFARKPLLKILQDSFVILLIMGSPCFLG